MSDDWDDLDKEIPGTKVVKQNGKWVRVRIEVAKPAERKAEKKKVEKKTEKPAEQPAQPPVVAEAQKPSVEKKKVVAKPAPVKQKAQQKPVVGSQVQQPAAKPQRPVVAVAEEETETVLVAETERTAKKVLKKKTLDVAIMMDATLSRLAGWEQTLRSLQNSFDHLKSRLAEQGVDDTEALRLRVNITYFSGQNNRVYGPSGWREIGDGIRYVHGISPEFGLTRWCETFRVTAATVGRADAYLALGDHFDYFMINNPTHQTGAETFSGGQPVYRFDERADLFQAYVAEFLRKSRIPIYALWENNPVAPLPNQQFRNVFSIATKMSRNHTGRGGFYEQNTHGGADLSELLDNMIETIIEEKTVSRPQQRPRKNLKAPQAA